MDIEDRKALIRDRAENDLEFFIKLVHPGRVLGSVHSEIIRWWDRPDAKSHQLLLLPRDHQKSALAGYRTAQKITKFPFYRILYISSTSNLATKQLKFIKDILTSDIYRYYWPEMVNRDEGKREKWTETEISVDHPLRRKEAVRDPTIFTAGLTTNIAGLHCDVAVMDDVVVQDNAYTQDGREKVRQQYSLLSSIEGADGQEWVVGTRYHPNDLYNDLMEMNVDIYNEDGGVETSEPLFEKFERQVETIGDGSGEFIWPRQKRKDGKWFGFNSEVLAKKRAQYLDRVQFRAQYYNDPNDYDTATVQREWFQYYDPKHLQRRDGKWYYRFERLNLFASVDFAFSLKKKADYTTIVVIGIDARSNYYILEIDRFKTDLISDYFQHILKLHQKWDFRKIRCEVSVAQQVIVNDLKNSYIRPHGLALSIEEYRPNRHQGTKEERVAAILQPRYQNRQIWHYQGGNTQILEEELVMSNPSHDDVKDALASCIDSAIPPTIALNRNSQLNNKITFNSRFGGVS